MSRNAALGDPSPTSPDVNTLNHTQQQGLASSPALIVIILIEKEF
jgi:hypothetical protein